MRGQAGFWDIDERYARLSEAGDPLEKLNAVVPWEVFRGALARALKRWDGAKGAAARHRRSRLRLHEPCGHRSPARLHPRLERHQRLGLGRGAAWQRACPWQHRLDGVGRYRLPLEQERGLAGKQRLPL